MTKYFVQKKAKYLQFSSFLLLSSYFSPCHPTNFRVARQDVDCQRGPRKSLPAFWGALQYCRNCRLFHLPCPSVLVRGQSIPLERGRMLIASGVPEKSADFWGALQHCRHCRQPHSRVSVPIRARPWLVYPLRFTEDSATVIGVPENFQFLGRGEMAASQTRSEFHLASPFRQRSGGNPLRST